MATSWSELIELLSQAGVPFEAGLTTAEIAQTEAEFGIRFPADLAEFLQTGLPTGDGFPNWRAEPRDSLRKRLDLPRRGVLFDVQHNNFWLPEWGPRPAEVGAALQHAANLIDQAPRLIPVYSHRMMPDRPHESGNPVFSVHQTDIIYYGLDLPDYLAHEFLRSQHSQLGTSGEPRKIEFWDIDRFQEVRWSGGPVTFDNRDGILP